jgi:hypothetical protein
MLREMQAWTGKLYAIGGKIVMAYHAWYKADAGR